MASSRRKLIVTTLALAGLSAFAARAEDGPSGDAARGARIGYTCLGCHGIPDYRNAYPGYHVPKLGGQHYAYLVAALGEYRAGARPHPTMKGQTSSLTEQALRDLAAYFATSEPVQSGAKATGSAPKAAEACAACHGGDGVGLLPEFPTLSGQHADYIEQALRAYRSGARQHPIMNAMATPLKDADIHALAEYFAAQSPSLRTASLPVRPRAR